MNRFISNLLDAAEEQGFRVVLGRGKHSSLVYPVSGLRSDRPVIVQHDVNETSPGHAAENVKSQLRRIGVDLGDRKKKPHEEPTMAAATNGASGAPIVAPQLGLTGKTSPLTRAREHLSLAIENLSAVEGCLAEAELDVSKLSQLRQLLGQL